MNYLASAVMCYNAIARVPSRFCLKVIDMAPKANPVDVDYIIREYSAGKSCLQLAREFDVSRGLIKVRLERAGVPVRNHSQAASIQWSNKTPEARKAQTKAANDAARGSKRSFEQLCRRAKANEISQSQVSALEEFISHEMSNRGIRFNPQTAVGPYNCDFTIDSIAVEVFGGGFHFYGRHLARTEERFRYVMDSGYSILAITIDHRFPFTPAVADYLAGEIQKLRRNPPEICQYRVIWGAGDATTGGSCKDKHISIEYPFRSSRDRRSGQYMRIPR